MTVTALASISDVETALGRELTTSETTIAEHALDKASELFRREARQTFTPGTSTVRLKVNASRVYLPERPVTAVASLVDDDGNDVEYVQVGQSLAVNKDSSTYLTVTYSHGDEVPDLVRLAIAEIAARNVSLDQNARAGMSQFSSVTGPFSESGTFAAWAVGGQVMLAPADAELARSYRPRRPSLRVQSPATTPGSAWQITRPEPWQES